MHDWMRPAQTASPPTLSVVEQLHWKEFNYRNDDVFGPWSNFKRKRFVEAQEKIIKNNSLFRVSVGLESAVHADIKKE